METCIRSQQQQSVNISGLIKHTSELLYVGVHTLSVSRCVHSEWLAGLLYLVMCQGCTEGTVIEAEMGLGEAPSLFTVNC